MGNGLLLSFPKPSAKLGGELSEESTPFWNKYMEVSRVGAGQPEQKLQEGCKPKTQLSVPIENFYPCSPCSLCLLAGAFFD